MLQIIKYFMVLLYCIVHYP